MDETMGDAVTVYIKDETYHELSLAAWRAGKNVDDYANELLRGLQPTI